MDPLPNLDSAPRVALVVDNPLRDLAGLCLVGLELIERGCKVFLVPMYLNDELFALGPDFVLLNYLRTVSEGLASNLLSHHIQYGVLDTEGGPNSELDNKYISYLCQNAKINGNVAAACCWGPELAGMLAAKGVHPPEKIFVTGNPRFDLYREPWRGAVAEFSEKSPEEFVLICSNFGLTNSQYGDRDKVAASLKQFYAFTDAEVEHMMSEETLGIEQLTEVVTTLAREFPDLKFIFRPHPFESTASYQELFDALPNVSLVKRGAVTGWMIEAKAVIQLNCTTCYDAWFAGTPSLKPAWIRHEAGVGAALSINHPCADMDSLVTAVRNIGDGKLARELAQDQRALGLVHRFFGDPDGKSHQRVADVIMQKLDLSTRKKRLRALGRVRHASARAAGKLHPAVSDLFAHAARFAGFQSVWNVSNLKSRRALLAKHDASEKAFTVPQVEKITRALASRKNAAAPRVEMASAAREFAFGGRFSRTIAILPPKAAHSRPRA